MHKPLGHSDMDLSTMEHFIHFPATVNTPDHPLGVHSLEDRQNTGVCARLSPLPPTQPHWCLTKIYQQDQSE